MEAVDTMLQPFADSIGFPVDQLKLVSCLLLSYPLALIHRQLPNATMKHIFSLFFGVLYGVACFGFRGMAHTIAMSLIPYVFAHVPLAGSYSHVVAFVVVLLYLFAMHTYRMITDYGGWTMDITGPLMLIAVKSSAFAFNVADGRRKSTELSAEQQRYAVAQVPSLLEYLGFIYFFAGFVAGPSFELTDYLTLSNRTTATTPPHSAHITALRRLLTGLLCMSGVILNGQYPLSLTTQSFFVDDWSFLQRCGFVFFFVSLQRFKYYFAWKLAEGSCIASGLCVEKDGSCEGITNINILGVEFSTSFKGIADNWNIGIAKWLKRYIYLRLSPSGKNVPLSTTVTTYLTSAFWHGPYPGYALFFGLAAVITDLARSLRRHLRPFVMKADGKTPKSIKPLYDIAGWALSIFCLNYAAVPFVLLNIDDSLTYYSAMKYCVHIGLVIVFILYKFLGFGRLGVTKVKKTQ